MLTGGPCGGKSSLITELLRDAFWHQQLVFVPEAIHPALQTGIAYRSVVFQHSVSSIQMAIEDALAAVSYDVPPEAYICHRGSLDPLGYWLAAGGSQREFVCKTGMSLLDHYERYDAVIHLESVANGCPEHYRSFPHAHRHESVAEASRLDRILGQVWNKHRNYVYVGNGCRDWAEKSEIAKGILNRTVNEGRHTEKISG